MDVSAHFSALDDEEFFVVEDSGWRGRRESDSQMFCHLNSMHAWWHIDKDMSLTSRPHHHQHHHHRKAFDSNTRFLACVTVMFPNPADGLCADRAHGMVGAARRRRNRRLRAFLKHERMTVAMNLATIQHHSYMKSAVVNVGVQVGSPLAPVIESYPSSGLVGPQFSLTVYETSHVAPAVSLSVPSQQLPVVYSKTTVTTDDLEEFIEPVYDHVHQEQIFAGEITETIAEVPVVLELVIVQEIPDVIVPLPPAEEFSAPVYDQAHQVQIAASEITVAVLPQEGAPASHLFSAFAVQKTVEIPQLQFLNIVVVFSFRAAEADPHGPDSSADH